MVLGMKYTSTYQSETGLFSPKMLKKQKQNKKQQHTHRTCSFQMTVCETWTCASFPVVWQDQLVLFWKRGSSVLLLGPTAGAQRDRNASQQLSSWSGKLTLPTTCPFSPCAGMEDTDVGRLHPSSHHRFIFRHCAHIRSNNGEWLCLTEGTFAPACR